jgi:hypothetical protein
VEERISEIEDKVKEILHSESNGKKTQQAWSQLLTTLGHDGDTQPQNPWDGRSWDTNYRQKAIQ